jgi:transposase
MARKPQLINLSSDELRSLKTSLRKGATPARVQTRARVLDLLHRQHTPTDIAAMLQVGIATIFNIKRRYLAEGLDAALIDKPAQANPARLTAWHELRSRLRPAPLLPLVMRVGRSGSWRTKPSNSASAKASRTVQSKKC